MHNIQQDTIWLWLAGLPPPLPLPLPLPTFCAHSTTACTPDSTHHRHWRGRDQREVFVAECPSWHHSFTRLILWPSSENEHCSLYDKRQLSNVDNRQLTFGFLRRRTIWCSLAVILHLGLAGSTSSSNWLTCDVLNLGLAGSTSTSQWLTCVIFWCRRRGSWRRLHRPGLLSHLWSCPNGCRTLVPHDTILQYALPFRKQQTHN